MMKEFIIQQRQQPQQQILVEENMSNLTSASGDQASVSSSFASPPQTSNPPPSKKKRSLPGNPDPDAEVIALSPKTLMATNRFVCEICNKGFQRDQNLQLHKRGHNLPWKLKQRSSKEVRRKVYICPEVTCVHHDPARALGDLTGIKKHFSRKHGEKKWKCDKCSKKYAVQSDWKAHSKICGTREYRCDCGTLFSRRDSFITHRAFCDALAEESARAISANPLANSSSQRHSILFPNTSPLEPSCSLPSPIALQTQFPQLSNHGLLQELTLKREQQQQLLGMRPDNMPSWLGQQQDHLPSPAFQEYTQESTPQAATLAFSSPTFQGSVASGRTAAASAHMSATALLQKAAQMGSTLSRPSNQGQMASHSSTSNGDGNAGSLVQDMVVNPISFGNTNINASVHKRSEEGGSASRGGSANEGLTRDFLGLRAFSRRDILNMTGFDPCMASSSSSYEQAQQQQKQWHG